MAPGKNNAETKALAKGKLVENTKNTQMKRQKDNNAKPKIERNEKKYISKLESMTN